MESRSKNVKKNIIYAFILKAAGVGISFLTLPLTIHYLTEVEYGIWVTLFSVLSWVNVLDMGLGLGLRNKMTEAVSKNDSEACRMYISSGLVALCVLSIIFFVMFILGLEYVNLQEFFNTYALSEDELYDATLLTGIIVLLLFAISLINQIYYAYQMPSWTGRITVLNGIVMLAVIYYLTLQPDHKLIYFVSSVGIAAVISRGYYIISFFRNHKEVIPHIKYVDLCKIKSVSTLGFKFFIIQICCIFGFSFSNILITKLLGPEYVRTYDVVFKIFQFSIIIQNLALNSLWSAYTDAYVKKDFTWIKRIFWKTVYGSSVIGVGIIIVAFFIDDLIYLWIHMKFDYSIYLVYFAVIYHLLELYAGVCCMLLNGLSRITVQMYSWLIAASVVVPLAWLFTKYFGMAQEGIMLSLVVSMCILMLILPVDVFKLFKSWKERD